MTATIASPIPVLPDVPSIIVPPGFSFPSRSASSIIRTAMRSLIELPGLNVSSLTSTSASITPRVMLWMWTIGVLPMASRMVSQIFRSGDVATALILRRCEHLSHRLHPSHLSRPFVLPVPRFAGGDPLQCGHDAPLTRLIGLRRINPLDVLAPVAWREGVERRTRLCVLPERGTEIGRHCYRLRRALLRCLLRGRDACRRLFHEGDERTPGW